uniref:Alpha-tocopherol transfer protein-like n=2 Tax=Cacopsylla melanoneura TaxID=428564 RepID=A0A8D8SYI9_9HEMI
MTDIKDQQLMEDMLKEHKEDIVLLKQWISHQQNIPKTITDEEILMFLHSNYYNLKNTEKTMSTYYTMRGTVQDFFTDRNFNTGTMKQVQDVVKFCFLPNRTPKGWAILIGKLNTPDSSQLHLDSAIKLLFMHLDTFLQVNPLVSGVVFMFDMQGVTMSHLTRINLSVVRKYMTYVEEAIPFRLKEIRIINVNNVITHIMNMIKPFMNKNHLQFIKMHAPGDLAEMYEKIPRELLPKDYDGEEASFGTLNKLAVNHVNENIGRFEDEEKLLAQLNKNFKKSNVTIEGSFRKLDIDRERERKRDAVSEKLEAYIESSLFDSYHFSFLSFGK